MVVVFGPVSYPVDVTGWEIQSMKFFQGDRHGENTFADMIS
jgi:hypothetical protein